MDLFIIRIVFIAVVAVACYHLQPFGLARVTPWLSAGAGVIIGIAVVWFETRLRVVSLKRPARTYWLYSRSVGIWL